MMPITGYLSLRIPQAGLELILGFFLIALGLYYMFFAKNLRIAPTPGAGILAGGVSGLFGGPVLRKRAPPPPSTASPCWRTRTPIWLPCSFTCSPPTSMPCWCASSAAWSTPSVWIWSGASVLGMLLGVFLGRLVYSRVKLEMLKQWISVFIALMGAWTALFPLPKKIRLSKRESVL